MTEIRTARQGCRGLRQGGLAVFPLQPQGKEPAVAGGLHRATTDVAEVRAGGAACPS